jgi:DNA-binding MarR family transcriptional regulator
MIKWELLRQMLQTGLVNPSQMANQLGRTRGAISKLIERLVDKALVERTSDVKDRRYQHVSLTAKGRKLVPILARLAHENDAEMFGHLTPQTQAELVRLLEGIVQQHGWKNVPVN